MRKLYFVNHDGDYEFVCDIVEDNELFISKALDDLYKRYPKFQSYYQRSWIDDEGSTWIDYGSHYQFYVLKNEN